jgi:hypothetical protein
MTKDILLYCSNGYDRRIEKLCEDINAMILHSVAFCNLDCSKVRIIRRNKRFELKEEEGEEGDRIGDSATLLPELQEFNSFSLVSDKNQPQVIENVLKATRAFDYVSHPVNYLENLPHTAKQIALSEDKNVAICGVDSFLELGEDSLRVIVRTNKGCGKFPIPKRLKDEIIIDIDKPPADAWDEIISKGVSGLPPQKTSEAPVSKLDSLIGSLAPKEIRETKGRGGGRGHGRNVTFKIQYERITHGDYIFSGKWCSVPSDQREAYLSDLKRAVALGHQILKMKKFDESQTMFKGMPIAWIRDAFEFNYRHDIPSLETKKVHDYSRGTPWKRDSKRDNPMYISTFYSWATQLVTNQ